MENRPKKPKYRPPFESKKGVFIKFTLPSRYAPRLKEEMQKKGFKSNGLCAKSILIDYLSYPKYSKFIEIMKLIKEFEASCLE